MIVARAPLASDEARRLIDALNAELVAAYQATPGANHFGLAEADVAPGRGIFVIARDGDRAVGCGAMRLLDPATGELKRMYVEAGLRGKGIGLRIVEALEGEARALGATRLVLETGIHQHAAIALYDKCGFARIPLYGEYTGSPVTSVCMGKSLA